MEPLSAALLLSPILIQGLLTAADEVYFHRKRGLPPWEVWGHPLDTCTVIGCYAFLLIAPPDPTNLALYGSLALISSLFVTKDEFVHKRLCSAEEQWLHALLFLVHPVAFGAAALLWWKGEDTFLWLQLAALLLFLAYQILYWGRPWRILIR